MNETPTGATAEIEENRAPASYAWRRYFARMFDITVIMGIILFMITFISILAIYLIDQKSGHFYATWIKNIFGFNFILGAILSILLWLPIEGWLLSKFCTTPGKYIFGIKVRKQTGKNMNYSTAISRAFLVFMKGQAFAIPVLSLIASIIAYMDLTDNGITSWDRKLKTTVEYERLGNVRLIFCILAALVWLLITIASTIRHFALLKQG